MIRIVSSIAVRVDTYLILLSLVGRDPDSRPPSNLPQKIMNTIHLLYKWSKTPEAFVHLVYSNFYSTSGIYPVASFGSSPSSIHLSPWHFGFQQLFSPLPVSFSRVEGLLVINNIFFR